MDSQTWRVVDLAATQINAREPVRLIVANRTRCRCSAIGVIGNEFGTAIVRFAGRIVTVSNKFTDGIEIRGANTLGFVFDKKIHAGRPHLTGIAAGPSISV